MPPKTKKPTDKVGPPIGLLHYPRLPIAEANKEFMKTVQTPNDGSANSAVDAFIRIMAAIAATLKSFTINDVLYYARPFGMESSQTMRLFDRWCEVMLRYGLIEGIEGVYDEKVILFV
jgi:hypothetical protein